MSNHSLTVGNVEIVSLQDVAVERFPMPLSEIYPTVTAEQWQPFRERYPETFSGEDGWRIDVACYLVRSAGRTILVDTGAGPATTGFSIWCETAGTLLDRLREAGVREDEVDEVLLSHLHWDHVGWNVLGEGADTRLTFPNARYRVHEADWETFHKPEVQAAAPFPFVEELVTPLERLGALETFSGDLSVTAEVTMLHTPGHTPGSASVLVSSGGEKAVIWGDAMVHPVSVTEPEWAFSFDMEPEKAIASRKMLLDRAEAEGWTACGCHFPDPGYGKIVRIEGRRWWQGVEL